jgi:hypothetical protein
MHGDLVACEGYPSQIAMLAEHYFPPIQTLDFSDDQPRIDTRDGKHS